MRESQFRRAVDPALYAGVDIGIDNLAVLASDKPGFVPRVVNGRPVKSINQFYNKRRAELQSHLEQARDQSPPGTTYNAPNAAIDHELHAASRRIIDLLAGRHRTLTPLG
jgi:transposase